MKIEPNKIYSHGCVVEPLEDGSVRLIRYARPEGEKQERLTIEKDYGYHGCSRKTTEYYTLTVRLPDPPKVGDVIMVDRTSVNCWHLVIGTPRGMMIRNCKTLTDINDILHDLLDQ